MNVTDEMVEAAFAVAPLNYFQPRGDDEGGFIRCSIDTGEIRMMLEAALSVSAQDAEPVEEQWRALEDGNPKTSWRALSEGNRPGWMALAKRSPEKYAVETRPLYLQPTPAHSGEREALTVDDLAQEIRRVDGSNSMGAGALAEALMSFIAKLAAIEGTKP